MDKIQEYYDVIARAVRLILDCETDADDIYAVPRSTAEYQERKILELIDNNDGCPGYMEKCLEKSDLNYISAFITKLDECAYKQLQNWMNRWSAEFDDCKEIDGLNSIENQAETGLLIIPKFMCMWEGKSGQSNHCLDVNIFLRHSHVIILKGEQIISQRRRRNWNE